MAEEKTEKEFHLKVNISKKSDDFKFFYDKEKDHYDFNDWDNRIIYANVDYKGQYIFKPYYCINGQGYIMKILPTKEDPNHTPNGLFTLQDLNPAYDIILFYPAEKK